MKFTRKSYGRLHRADDTVVSQHVVAGDLLYVMQRQVEVALPVIHRYRIA